MKTLLLILVLFIVMPLMMAKPAKVRIVRKTCGRDLVNRVNQICQNRGGHLTHTRAHRVRRGIVDECCMQICPDSHLWAYCSNDGQDRIPTDTETSIETSELDAPESLALVSSIDSQNAIQRIVESATDSPVETVTSEPDHRYQNIVLNGNVDSDVVERLIKKLPYTSNDFIVGTVPPEFLAIPRKYLVRGRLFSK